MLGVIGVRGGAGRARRLGAPGRARPRRLARMTRRFRLDLADRLFERQPLARDLGFFERRSHAAKLRHQRDARPLVKRAPVLAGVLFQTGDGAGDQRMVVGHRALRQVSKGLCIRMVSSRSGLVDSNATGQPINSSMRRTYFTASAGSSAHERALAVIPFQPSAVS